MKFVTSTTSVSPSKCPTESPMYEGSASARCGRPSVGITRKTFVALYRNTTWPGVCTIWFGVPMRGTPAGLQ